MKKTILVKGLALLMAFSCLLGCAQQANLANNMADTDDKEEAAAGNASGQAAPTDTSSFQTIGEWKLVWNDEFDGIGDNLDTNGLDLSKWGYQTGTGAEYGLNGWGNDEQEYYQKENAAVSDGKLAITARKETVGGKPYTSARLWTKDNYSTKFGRIEAAIQMPEGDGLWPAFWMLPVDESIYGAWAAGGEIDIMEARGRINFEVSGTIHYGQVWPNNKYDGSDYRFPNRGAFSDGFHVYALEWEPGELRWYVDDDLFLTQNNWYSKGEGESENYPYPAPFDQEFYILLNMAVGGHFDGGLVPADEDIPAQMLVDYVRVYHKDSYPVREKPVIAKDTLPATAKQPVDGNYIYDTGFTNIITEGNAPADGWLFMTGGNNSGGKASVSSAPFDEDTNGFKMEITEAGTQDYAIQMMQQVPMAKGRTYKISFDARADAPRDIHTKVSSGGDGGWKDYSPVFTASLNAEPQHFEFEFPMESNTHLKARLELNLGLDTAGVYIADVRFEEVDE